MPFCPKCKYEYVEGIEMCPDCDLKLIPKLHEPKPEEHIDENLVTVGSYVTDVQAQVAQFRLQDFGIQSVIANEKMGQADLFVAIMDGGIKVQVRESDAAAARKALGDG
jgi:hypothetical protein